MVDPPPIGGEVFGNAGVDAAGLKVQGGVGQGLQGLPALPGKAPAVEGVQLFHAALGTAHRHRAVGADDEDLPRFFQPVDLVHPLVVALGAGEAGLQKLRVGAVAPAVEPPHHPVLAAFAKARLPREHQHRLARSEGQLGGQRHGIGHAAVQADLPPHLDHAAHQGQAGGGAHRVHEIQPWLILLKIHRAAGAAVGGHRPQLLGRGIEGVEVQRVEGLAHLAQQEIEVEIAEILDEMARAHVPGVVHIVQIHRPAASRLAGYIVHAVERPGADPRHLGKIQVVFHEHVQHARGEQAPHGAPFQNEGGVLFHFLHAPFGRFPSLFLLYSPGAAASQNNL